MPQADFPRQQDLMHTILERVAELHYLDPAVLLF